MLMCTSSQQHNDCRCQHPHEWQTQVYQRTAKDRSNDAAASSGCPFCSGRVACPCSSLKASHPHIAEQWHPTRNGALRPEQCRPGSGKKVWWQHTAADGALHEWATKIDLRTREGGTGCPFCNLDWRVSVIADAC